MTTQSTSSGVDARGLDEAYPLTDEQVRSIQEDGWALLPGLLSPDVAGEVRETLLAAEMSTTLAGPAKKPVDVSQMLKHEGVVWRNDFLRSVATSPRLSSAVVGLMQQSEALLTHDISFFKPVGAAETRWHQDYSFWPYDRKGCLSLWIALSDIDETMGPLNYLPGSHREGPLGQYDFWDGNPQLHALERVGARSLKAGDAQAHWGLTVHGAAPNEGPHRRDATAFRYHRVDVAYTGLSHPHFDSFGMDAGVKFADTGLFPRVGRDGLVESTEDRPD